MVEKRKKIVNTVFVSLIIATLVLGILCCVRDFASYKDFGDDAKFLYAFAVILYPALALFVFSSEVFLWQSVVFLVSYPGHRRIELILRILLAAVSAAALGYWAYYVFLNSVDNSRFPLYAFGFQLFCQFLIWICRAVKWMVMRNET